MTKMKRYR